MPPPPKQTQENPSKDQNAMSFGELVGVRRVFEQKRYGRVVGDPLVAIDEASLSFEEMRKWRAIYQRGMCE